MINTVVDRAYSRVILNFTEKNSWKNLDAPRAAARVEIRHRLPLMHCIIFN